MIEGWIHKLVDKLYDSEEVTKKEKDLVAFGLVQGTYTALETLGIVIIGGALNLFPECIVILVTFVAIRIYAGGYHADTPLVCALKTWFMFFCGFLVLRYVKFDMWFSFGSMVLCAVVILLIAPIQHPNRVLDECEMVQYRKKALRNWFAEMVLFVVACGVERWTWIAKCLAVAVWMVMILMFLGRNAHRKAMMKREM